MNTFSRIMELRVVPVLTVERVEDAVPLVDALARGGLGLAEITFRTTAAEEAVRRVRAERPDVMMGAGTLLTEEQVDRAAAAGAQFGVAPGLREKVVARAKHLGLPFIPGVMTPSEVEHALALGCRLLKFFPAEAAGGVAFLKTLAGPYAHTGVSFIPLGGVRPGNLAAYLSLENVAAVGGSWMAERELVREGRWDEITRRARTALDAVKQLAGKA